MGDGAMNQPALPPLPSHGAGGLPLLHALRLLDLLSWTRRPVTARELFLLYKEEHGPDIVERTLYRVIRNLSMYGWIECSHCECDEGGRCPNGPFVGRNKNIRAHTWRLGRIAERLVCSIGGGE